MRYPPHRERSREEDQVLPFRTRHHLCQQDMAPTGNQQLRMQDPTPARRCSTEGRIGHQGREGGNRDGNRDGGGDGREYECMWMSTRVGMEAVTEVATGQNGDKYRDEGGGKRELGLEDVRRWATRTSNQ